ncbi:MAG: TetR/AcrR family transcriptional regulator [Deltaproteobacteria bacterium]|nr:TetR/AcrR family transcriptional regulator [Kofleriaceae bacterium]
MTDTQPSYADRRAEMADQTRVRILEACVRILGRGVAELSIPAVAREAAVSVPTVYRHFADKRTLFHETAMHLRRLRGPYRPASSVDELPATIREQFALAGSLSEVVRTALQSEPIMTVRRESGEGARRVAHMESLLAGELRDLSPSERERAATVIALLCSSMTLRTMMELPGQTPEQAAQTVIWAVGRLLGRDLEPRPRGKGKGKR